MMDPGQSSGSFSEEEITRIARRFLPRVERELAAERARLLWDSLCDRFALPLEEKPRFLADKTADFMRTTTSKDRQDILNTIVAELRRRRS